jgi:hypothetical protein
MHTKQKPIRQKPKVTTPAKPKAVTPEKSRMTALDREIVALAGKIKVRTAEMGHYWRVIGRLLTERKGNMEHGEWGKFLDTMAETGAYPFEKRMAQNYMKIYENHKHLIPENNPEKNETIAQAGIRVAVSRCVDLDDDTQKPDVIKDQSGLVSTATKTLRTTLEGLFKYLGEKGHSITKDEHAELHALLLDARRKLDTIASVK